MSLYPSLEDMVVDQEVKAEVTAAIGQAVGLPAVEAPKPFSTSHTSSASSLTYGSYGAPGGLYANLGLEEMMSFAGLDISQTALVSYMPEEVAVQVTHSDKPLAKITSEADQGVIRAQIKQGVRPVRLAKDQKGLIGIAVAAIDKGLFVAFVWENSAAALAGVRFGDQILQINGESVAGWTTDKALKILKKADGTRIDFAIRDRPFERAVTVQKDSRNQIGFVFKKGEITALVKDSSAARNGLLINHNIIEVNGRNVVGMKDADLLQLFKEVPQTVTLTVIPTFIFQHLVKKIGFSKIKKYMDHSVPEI